MESQRQRIDISRSVLGREELRAPVRQQLQHHKRKILKIYPIAALSIIHTLTGIVMTLTGTALATYPKKVVDDLPMLGIIGICVGIPVFITGILGIMLYRDPKNSCKIVCNLLISILTFFVSLVGIMFHTIAVSIPLRDDDSGGKIIICILLSLEILEFLLTMTSHICFYHCCKNTREGFVKIKLWAVNSTNLPTELELSSSANSRNEAISQSGEERAAVYSLAFGHVNQSASLGCISVDQISDAPNTTSFSHQSPHRYQCETAEPTIVAPIPVANSVSHSSIELPPEDRVFTTEDSAVGTIEIATNIANSYRGPPPAYQELVIESDVARETQSITTNVSYSIREPPPAYQVSPTEASELEVTENVTNITYSSQEYLPACQQLPTEINRVRTIQNVRDDIYTPQRLPPTYEEAVTNFTESGAIQGILNVSNSIQDIVQAHSAVTTEVSRVGTVQAATNYTYSSREY